MCKFPTIIYIKPSGSETKIPFIKTCGKCYDCMMSARAAQVLRMRKEFTQSKSCFFVTLKYSDNNLVYWNFNKTERRQELDRLSAIGKSKPFDAYGKFIVEPRHATVFFQDMQKVIKKYSDNLLFRMVLNAEYGTWSHRPHYHVIVFSPLSFRLQDFKNLVQSVWKYGFVDVSEVNDARIAYVSKHSMKEDKGNELQQKVSPIFRRQSSYNGGIGKALINDETMLANYYQDSNYTYNGRYKVNIPRYIKKKLHPDTYSEEDLVQLSKDSYGNLVKRLWLEFGVNEDSIVEFCTGYSFTEWWSKFDMSKYDKNTVVGYDILKYKCAVTLMRFRNVDLCRQELRQYYENKFARHKQKLKEKGYFSDGI